MPAGPAATEAVLPTELVVAVDGALIDTLPADATGTFCVALPLQPLAVTVTLNETLGELPALKTIAFVPWPEVIVPPAMDHEYDAPLTTVADAALPLLCEQTDDGAVIVTDGAWLTLTFALPAAVQPLASVMVMLSATEPLPVGANVIAFVPLPLLIVALVALQLYVAPLVAATDALPLPVAQRVAGAEIVAFGSGLTVTATVDDVVLQPLEVSVTE